MNLIGIGTDIVDIRRVALAHARHGRRFARRILAPAEWPQFEAAPEPAAFLAKRFVAKEAIGKALGCGMGQGLWWSRIVVEHDAAGRPCARVAADLPQARAVLHLSVADERDYAVAHAVALGEA